ncbi:hypothetical protein BC827DRAFT_609932 [Russula dissimulans]|nr:hypothetical protein BC827DRAFT_609932 [Russula dissimulans]
MNNDRARFNSTGRGRPFSFPILLPSIYHSAMVDILLVALWGFLVIGSARSQVTAPECTDATFTWSYNSLDQNPCLIAAYLAAVCNNGEFSVPALLPQHSYNGPNGSDDDDICKCNPVLYNLISACDACQGDTWIPYVTWTANCTTVWNSSLSFPKPIPAETRVPKWAFLDPGDTEGNWNLQDAQSVGDRPEVTGSATIIPTATKGSQTTFTETSSSTSSTSSSGTSNTAAIAGGVVGGVIAACLIAGVVAWFVIRHRRARSAPSVAYMNGQGGNMEQTTVPYPLSIESPRLYDPSDPSTYPTQAPSPIYTTNYSHQYPNSTSDLQPNRQAYSGLPESRWTGTVVQ